MKRKIIIGVVIFAVIASGYVGFIKYEQHKFLESITPHIKNTSLRLTNDLRYETEEGTKITYKELFEKLESDIAEIDKRILDVQTIATPKNKEVTDPVIAYLKGGQELLRTLLLKFRKELAVRSATTIIERSLDDLRNANHYSFEYTKKAADRALNDLKKADAEYKEAKSDIRNAANNMKKIHAKLPTNIPRDALADPSIFEVIAKKYETN